MIAFVAALLAVAAPAAVETMLEPVEVRVRNTAGGPRVFVDGQPTAARMFWGLDNQKRRELTPDWRWHRLRVTPPADAGVARLTLNPDPGARGRVEVCGVSTNMLMRAEKGKTLELAFEARAVGELKGFRPALQQVTSGIYEYHGVLDLPPDDPEESNLISQCRGARKAGIRFISFFAPNAFADCGEPIDFAAWDAVMERLIAAVPDALIIPRVTVNPPARWFERHPDARIVNEHGERIDGPSIESEEYRRHAFDFVRRTARHFYEKYPRHFAGLHITGASTQEWYYYGSWQWLSGYDAGTAAAYRRWRAEQGLPPAAVPTPAERHGAADANGVIDAARHPNVIAFNRFLSARMVDFLGEINRIVRRETEGKKLTFAFYGYHYELVTFAHGYPASGNCALGRLLEKWKDAIDVLTAPLCYTDRGWLGTSPVIGPAETIRRNGILWLNEDDLRTHLGSELAGDGSWCCLKTATETRDAIRRTTLQEIIRGDTGWWMDHGAGWYDSEAEIWQPVGELAALEAQMLARPEPYVPEVALIVDEEMLLTLGDGSQRWAHPLINEGRFAVPRAGLSLGQYTLGDVRRRSLDARTRLRLRLVPSGEETDLTGPLLRTADGAVEVALSKLSAPLVHSLAIRAGLKPRLSAAEVGQAAVWSGSGLVAIQALAEGFRDFRQGEVRLLNER